MQNDPQIFYILLQKQMIVISDFYFFKLLCLFFFSRIAFPHSVFQYNFSGTCYAFLFLIYILLIQSQFIDVAELLFPRCLWESDEATTATEAPAAQKVTGHL